MSYCSSSIAIPLGKWNCLPVTAFVVDEYVQFIISKDALREFNAYEAHRCDWIEVESEHGPVRLETVVSPHNGYYFISIGGVTATGNVESSLISKAKKKPKGRYLVRKTHAPTVNMLLKCVGKWGAVIESELKKATKCCHVFLSQVNRKGWKRLVCPDCMERSMMGSRSMSCFE